MTHLYYIRVNLTIQRYYFKSVNCKSVRPSTTKRMMSKIRKSPERSSVSSELLSTTDSGSREGRKRSKNNDNVNTQSIIDYLDKKLINIERNKKGYSEEIQKEKNSIPQMRM